MFDVLVKFGLTGYGILTRGWDLLRAVFLRFAAIRVIVGAFVGFTVAYGPLHWPLAAALGAAVPVALFYLGMGHWADHGEPTTAPDDEEEPVDACGHDAPAEPVEVDWDGNGQPEVIGWLCAECGAKVSPPAAVRRNQPPPPPRAMNWNRDVDSLRAEFKRLTDQMRWMVDRWKGDDGRFTISERDYAEYRAVAEQAQAVRGAIDVAVRVADNRTRAQRALPPLPVETAEVRAYGSDIPIRSITTGSVTVGDDLVISPDGFTRVEKDR